MQILRFINGLFDRLFIVVGAFFGSQIPQFMEQYTQQLSGHVAELGQLVDQLRQIAALSNKTLEQYIQKFMKNSDADFANQGTFMQSIVSRWQDFSFNLEKIKESTIWSRPFEMVSHFNYDIARSTVESFQAGLSLTLEGLIYAGIGILISFLFYRLLIKLIVCIYLQFVFFIRRLFRLPQKTSKDKSLS